MLWNHEWSEPQLRVMQSPRGNVHLPLQECVVCGSRRNAITKEVTLRKRGSTCHRMPTPPAKDHRDAMKRLEFAMDAIESDGGIVAREWRGNRKPRPESEQLGLAYKD